MLDLMLGCPQHTHEILKKPSKLYHNPENSGNFLCSPRATELCMQTFLLLRAEPTVLLGRVAEGLSLSYSAPELEVAESGLEACRISHKDYLCYVTVD
jgi:hypothetical protein